MGRTIDHPDVGGLTKERPSKDISDACAGSIYNCKQKSTGGKAVAAFEDFTERLEAAQRQVTLRDRLKSAGMSQRRSGGRYNRGR
jgi:hypothetical protein